MKRLPKIREVQSGTYDRAEWSVSVPPIQQTESAVPNSKQSLPRILFPCAFWAILGLLLPAANAWSEPGSPSRMILNDSAEFAVGPFLDTLEDPKQNLNYETVRSLDASEFKPADSRGSLNLGFQHSDYWGRVDLENRSKNEHFFLSHPISLTDHLEIWFKTRAGTTHLKSGDVYPFSEKTVPYYGHAFRLELPSGESGQLVIRMHTTSAIWFSFGLETEDSFLASQEQDYLLLGGYAGLMAVMIVYNLVMFFSIRDGSFLSYIIYILFFALSQLALKGIAAQYIWGEWPVWNNYSFLVLVALASAALLLFSVQFLNLREYLPRIRWILLGLATVALPASLLPFLTGYATAVRIVNIYALILPVLVICIALWIARKGYIPAQYYIFAFLFFFAGAMVFSAAARGWLPANIWTANAMLSGSAVQVVLLSLGLGSRINGLRLEKEKAQAATIETQENLLRVFHRFVPRQFIEHLKIERIEELRLGDHIEREMTVCFCDVRSFTTLSESMTPNQNFAFINELLSALSPIIASHSGFIDKYIGDAIMALFPDPGSAFDAAAEMQTALHKKNADSDWKHTDQEIRIGVGLHHGPLMLGTVGETERMDTTVISDAVNIASRVESLTKKLGAEILLSEAVYANLIERQKDQCRRLGPMRLKGKEANIVLYDCFAALDERTRANRKDFRTAFEEATRSLEQQEVQIAGQKFKDLLRLDPSDRIVEILAARISRLQ